MLIESLMNSQIRNPTPLDFPPQVPEQPDQPWPDFPVPPPDRAPGKTPDPPSPPPPYDPNDPEIPEPQPILRAAFFSLGDLLKSRLVRGMKKWAL